MFESIIDGNNILKKFEFVPEIAVKICQDNLFRLCYIFPGNKSIGSIRGPGPSQTQDEPRSDTEGGGRGCAEHL